MTQHSSATFRNPYRKGSAFNPIASQREEAIEEYMDENPDVSATHAAYVIDELFRDFIEEHA